MADGAGLPKMGYDSALGVVEETAWGTYKTVTSYFEFSSESLKQEREEKLYEHINTSRDIKKRFVGNESVSGSVEADLDISSDAICFILKNAMGGTVTSSTVTAAGTYQHTFNTGDMVNNDSSISAADTEGLTFSVRRGATSTACWAYYGCRINQLTIKGEIGEPVMFTAEIIGQGASIGATVPSISYSDILPVNFTGVAIKTGATITSVTEEYFTSFEFTLNNNLDGDQRSLGSRNITVLPPGKRNVNLKLSQRFDTVTSYNRFIENTLTAIEITLDTGVTIGAATTYAMIINVPAGYYNTVAPEVGGNETLTHEIDVTGLYATDPAYSVQFIVRNATQGY